MTRVTRVVVGTVAAIGLIVALGLAVVLRGTLSLPAPTAPSAGAPAGPISQARLLVQPLLAEYPGLAVAVVGAGDRVLWSEGFGYADIASKRPVGAETLFRIYSISKPITAAAAARLAEDGALDLDAPVSTYVPELPPHLGRPTARQLIGHLAGVRHYHDGEWLSVSRAPCSTPVEGLRPILADSLVSAPGAGYTYSSFGYVLLSAVIEAAAREPFEEVVRRLVLDPAGMTSTRIERRDITNGLSTFYEPALFGRIRPARPVDNTCKWGAGAYVSSAVDLARFGHALAAGGIVEAETGAMVFRAMSDSSGKSTTSAFGWGVDTDDDGRRYAAASGGAIGGRAAVYLYPADGLAVAVVGNFEGAALTPTAQEIAEIFATTPGH